jgi:hypothetical protein
LDWLSEQGGETGVKPVEKASITLPDKTTVAWRQVTSWGDAVNVANGRGLKRDLLAYAYTTVTRRTAGKALLSIGSDERAPSPRVNRAIRNTMMTGATSTLLFVLTDVFLRGNQTTPEGVTD